MDEPKAIDLSAQAGLPLRLDRQGRLVYPPECGRGEPAARRLSDMRPYLADPGAGGPAELYFMHRDLGLPADRRTYGPQGLRFDITVLVPGVLAGEFVKTAGHHHPCPPGKSGLSYPEVYGVIAGRAHYLLQDGLDRGPSRAFLIDAAPGDIVLVPPNFGHVTINPGPGPLVMGNWVEATFASIYEPFAGRRGGCYYEFARGLEPNPRYGRPVPLRRLSASEFARECPPGEALWRSSGKPLYLAGARDPARLGFLTEPETYEWGTLLGRP